jgi:hypothetical protein
MRLLAWNCSHSDQVNAAHGLCSPCYHAAYYQKNAKNWPEYDGSYLTSVHRRCVKKGISESLYLLMLLHQDGKCPCGRELVQAHIDHNHACCSGRKACGNCVRGLLCRRCNLLLGMVESEPHLIPAYLAVYLTETNFRQSEAL